MNKESENFGVTTESQNRLPIFQASNKPDVVNVEFETIYGKVKITGKLGQSHKSLLETCLFLKEDYYYNTEDEYPNLKILVDMYKIRKFMSRKGGEYSYNTIMNLFKDMKETNIRLEKKNGWTGEGNLVSDILDNKKEISSKNKKFRKKKIIVLGVLATQLIAEELKFFYNPKPIINLKNGISKAIARFLFTQDSKKMPRGGYKLDTLIKFVNRYKLTNEQIRDIRKKFMEDKEILEKECNISITTDKHVILKKPPEVYVIETTKKED